eukprot:g1340.t1
MEAFANAVAGAVGTGVSKLVCYPLDTAKVRLSSTGFEGMGTLGVLRGIVSEEGMLGLYRGINNKLLKSCTQKFIYFYLFRILSDVANRLQGSKDPGSSALLIIGFLGELLANGVLGLYAGVQAYVVGCLQPAFQFSLFERFKKMAISYQGGNPQLSLATSFMIGAVTKAIAATIVQPVTRARILAQSAEGPPPGMASSILRIWRDDGFFALFRGAGLVGEELSSHYVVAMPARTMWIAQ